MVWLFNALSKQICNATGHPGRPVRAHRAPAPTILCGSAPETLVAAAILQSGEIQNLNDQPGDLVKAAVGLHLRFQLRVELGPAARLSHETVDKVNELL